MGYDDEDHDRSYSHQRNHYDLNSKVMITAIVSLSVVILLVAILHFYARCYLRRQARRGAALRDGMNFVVNSSRIRSIEPTLRAGLDPLVIASLPAFVFKKSDEKESTECAVCLSILEESEMARELPNCKHTFHLECVDRWFGSHSSCPICRTEAEPQLVPEAREGVVLPTAPPLERTNSIFTSLEGISEGGIQSSAKIGGSCSRLSSFRRILSRERSSRRVQSCGQEDGIVDLERQ